MRDEGTAITHGGDARSAPQWLGIALVVISTISIAIVPSLAKLAYEGGSNTLSVITGRSLFSVAITLCVLIFLRQPLRVPRRTVALGLASGACYAATLYGYLGAVNYLPVNVAILIYFTHPLFVGIVSGLLGHDKVSLTSVIALLAALFGLVLVIGLAGSTLNITGLGLALLGMLSTVAVILLNARAMGDASAITVGCYMMLSAATVLGLAFALFGELALPNTTTAWFGFIGVAVAATAGTLTFMGGMAIIGSTRAAMITNIEPVLGVVCAVAIVGESVTWIQSAGIALVVGAIFAMERYR